MSSHAHVVSRLSVHVLLIFAAKSVRTRMIHHLRMQRAMHVSATASLSFGTVQKSKACLFYTVQKERRESRSRRRARADRDTLRSMRHIRA